MTLGFTLLISTKPNVVRYSTSGSVTLEGKAADVKKKLEINPKTKIPQILFTVYQHVFNSIFMLSSILNTPYPPPDLLHPMAEKIQIITPSPPQQEKTEEQPKPEAAHSATPPSPPAAAKAEDAGSTKTSA